MPKPWSGWHQLALVHNRGISTTCLFSWCCHAKNTTHEAKANNHHICRSSSNPDCKHASSAGCQRKHFVAFISSMAIKWWLMIRWFNRYLICFSPSLLCKTEMCQVNDTCYRNFTLNYCRLPKKWMKETNKLTMWGGQWRCCPMCPRVGHPI